MPEALRLVVNEPSRERGPHESHESEPLDLDAANVDLKNAPAEHVVRWARDTFGRGLVMSSSFGAESAVMLHLVSRLVPGIPVIFLDTGYLFPETYTFAEEMAARFKLRLEVYTPRMSAARQEALYGRMWEGTDEDLARYNRLNKVEPMDRALEELGATAWIAGLRASQTQFRKGLRVIEPGAAGGVVKVHPILGWTNEDVRRYLHAHDLPYHPLYHYGYRSIGDWHSTSPTTLDQNERDGRNLGEKKECGIHLPRTPEANASLKSSGL